MIHIEKPACRDIDHSMHWFLESKESLLDKINTAIQVVKAMPINGCITGSCWLPGFDPDLWNSTPDIDVFVYSENELVKAIDFAMYKLEMKPGTGTDRSEKQELWKIERLMRDGINRKTGISTYKFYCDGIVVNFTYKMRKLQGRWVPITDAPGILMSFDMSIVMQGYDIRSGVMFDLRPDNVPANVAIPNPLRDHDCMMWTVAKWVRQFDRVIKYYDRGFDTRPMAKFYLDMIDKCIEAGCLFDSEESQEAFINFSEEFLEKRATIANWLEAHSDEKEE